MNRPLAPEATRLRRIEKSGWFIIGTALVFGIAAVNSGNNILYLAEALLLGLIIASGQISRRGLRAIRVELIPPDPPHARRLTKIRVRLSNVSKLWFLIGLDLQVTWERLQPEEPSPHLETAGYEVHQTIIFPGDRRKVNLAWSFDNRGIYRLKELSIGTRGPFGWFYRQGFWDFPLEVIVYPEPVSDTTFEFLRNAYESHPTRMVFHDPSGDEFYGLRDYMAGDSIRRIHWASSARRGTWQVRMMSKPVRPTTWIVLDRRMSMSDLERILSWLTALFLETFARRDTVGFASQHLDPILIDRPEHLHAVLAFLAACAPVTNPPNPTIHSLPGVWISANSFPPPPSRYRSWLPVDRLISRSELSHQTVRQMGNPEQLSFQNLNPPSARETSG